MAGLPLAYGLATAASSLIVAASSLAPHVYLLSASALVAAGIVATVVPAVHASRGRTRSPALDRIEVRALAQQLCQRSLRAT